MGEVLQFQRAKRRSKQLRERARGRIMCENNHHRWKLITERKFDVRQGRLVTEYRCERCGKQRLELL